MEKKETGSRAMKKAQRVADCYVDNAQQHCDPQGSWTGKPARRGEVPVQDADDL